MKIVYSDSEVDALRPYKEYKFLAYPARYPALISFLSHYGGLGGVWVETKTIAVPENVEPTSFIKGVLATPKSVPEGQAFGQKM